MKNRIPIWLDVDTGVDDASAILCALQTPCLEIVGTSAVDGNVAFEKTFKNTRDVLALAGRDDIKVYPGKDGPLIGTPVHAEYAHGKNGLGGVTLDDSKATIETKPAWDAIYQKAQELNGEMVLVAVGPLTDVAVLIQKHPDFNKYCKKIVIMGGGIEHGNITPYAEFNFYADPLAAKIVFEYDIERVMCGLDVTHRAYMSVEEVELFKDLQSKPGKFFYEAIQVSKQMYKNDQRIAVRLHDVNPIFYLAYPDMYTAIDSYVKIETEGERKGQSISDAFLNEKMGPANTCVVVDADRERFVKTVREALNKY